jgi:hypothetical protein
LQRAIDEQADFAFETTLGGKTMTALLEQAAQAGLAVHIWFAGLTDVELHIDRVRRRVAKGGHSIPAEKIRERFENGRVNLIRLLPHLIELYPYDNSAEADPDSGAAPLPRRLLYYRERRIVSPTNLKTLLEATPAWAKPIVAAAIKLHLCLLFARNVTCTTLAARFAHPSVCATPSRTGVKPNARGHACVPNPRYAAIFLFIPNQCALLSIE